MEKQGFMRVYQVSLKFVEPLLGVIPKNPDVYKWWLESKQPQGDEGSPPEETELKSWTGFKGDEQGLHIFDYHVKGFFKEAAIARPQVMGLRGRGDALAGEGTIRKRIEQWLFIRPRRIYLGKEKPDGFNERPLRAKTLQGDRIALVRSDYVDAGVEIQFSVYVVDECPITQEMLEAWLGYGAFKGLGQFRGGTYGSFEFVLEA